MKTINVLSLFDGMSCGQIALDQLGFKIGKYFASEIDKKAITITQKNYPLTIQIGNVTKVKYSKGILYTENGNHKIGKIHLLIGGSPCQGFSFAGKQLNFNDERSKLFFQYTRLRNEIEPDFFLLENVGMSKQSEAVITQYLGVEPIAINSERVTAQLRHRLYWTNIPNVKQPKKEYHKLSDIINSGYVDRDKSYCIDANYGKGITLESYLNKARRQIVFDNFNYTRIDNVPNTNNIKLKFRLLSPTEVERLQTVPEGYTEGVCKTARYHMLGNGWTVKVVKHIFKNMKPFYT